MSKPVLLTAHGSLLLAKTFYIGIETYGDCIGNQRTGSATEGSWHQKSRAAGAARGQDSGRGVWSGQGLAFDQRGSPRGDQNPELRNWAQHDFRSHLERREDQGHDRRLAI